jgi:hypothetical protein
MELMKSLLSNLLSSPMLNPNPESAFVYVYLMERIGSALSSKWNKVSAAGHQGLHRQQ